MRRAFTWGHPTRQVLWLGAALLVIPLVPGCQNQAPRAVPPAKADSPSIHRGPLTDYVPAAGLRWMVVGNPRVFAENRGFMGAFERLIPAERLTAFASGSGVELANLPEGCIAGFDYGTLYLARVGNNTLRVRQRFEARLVSDPVTRSPRAGIWRVTGLIANTPESLLSVDNDFSAIALGDPLLIRIVEGFALDRFKKTPPALAGAALSTLPSELKAAPLRFYAPGPFPQEWAKGAQGVLAQAFAFGVAVKLSDGARLQVHAVVSGSFGPDVQEARSRLLNTWDSIRTSAIGHVLGLRETTEPSRLEVYPSAATLDFSLNSESLMKGLAAAVSADTKGIFDL
jgi:hypothetical protein